MITQVHHEVDGLIRDVCEDRVEGEHVAMRIGDRSNFNRANVEQIGRTALDRSVEQ